jgi:hypothetical protein
MQSKRTGDCEPARHKTVELLCVQQQLLLLLVLLRMVPRCLQMLSYTSQEYWLPLPTDGL